MYISVKERKVKENKSYYFYACESKRIDGKVKNTQKYLFKITFDQMGYINNLIDLLVINIDLINGLNSEQKEEIKQKVRLKIKEVRYKAFEEFFGSEWTKNFKNKFDNESNSKNYSYNSDNNICNSNNYSYNTDLLRELIKTGYKQLSKKYHPDISGDNGTTMKELNRIYDMFKTQLNM